MHLLSLSTFTFCVFIPTLTSAQAPAQNGPAAVTPNVSASTEYSDVIYSPSAKTTPEVFRSVVQLEIAVKENDQEEASIRYADAVVISKDGLMACVFAKPNSHLDKASIESVDLLMLDGTAAAAKVLAVDPAHGLALFQVNEPNLSPMELSSRSLVAKRRLNWHAVYRQGQKTILYSRPLQVHRARLKIGNSDDFCQVIDSASSALTADRSGSALVALDGTLVALMGRQPHWDVSPKSVRPRTKVAHAVPASVIRQLVDTTMK